MNLCNDYGDALDCAKIPDDRYTMSFEDIGQGCIYWCSVCGPRAHTLDASIMNALKTRGDSFLKDFEHEVNTAHERIVKS